jgi:hypothetical protein
MEVEWDPSGNRIEHIYDDSGPGGGPRTVLHAPVAEVAIPRKSRVLNALFRVWAWALGEADVEARQHRFARGVRWLQAHWGRVRAAALGLLLALVVGLVLHYGWLHGYDDVGSGMVHDAPIANLLLASALREREAADPAMAGLRGRPLGGFVTAAEFAAGYYASGWAAGRRVNVSIERLHAALLAAPTDECAFATMFGVDRLVVRPPGMDAVLFNPVGLGGAGAAVAWPWPHSAAFDPYLAWPREALVVPRQQLFEHATASGPAAPLRLVGQEVACVAYARHVAAELGGA